MFRRKRKFNELDDIDNKDCVETNAIPNKKQKLSNYLAFNTLQTLPVKKTFARNRRNKCKTKHLTKSVVEAISESDSDSDFDPNGNNINNNKVTNSNRTKRKYVPLKLTAKTSKKVQSTLDFPIIRPFSNINKTKYNKCAPTKCSDCGMLYYIGRNEDDSLHSKYHKKYMDKFENGYKPLILSEFTVWNFKQIAMNAPYFVEKENKNKNKNKNYKQMKLISNDNQQNKMNEYKNRNDLILCIKYDQFIEVKDKHCDILSCVDMMDRELGYFTTKQLKNNGIIDDKYNKIVHSLDEHQSLYCFVEKTGHKIVGCIVCEPREFAYKIKIKINEKNEKNDMDNVERNDLKEKCYIGIVKIWVHHKHRRKCIGSLLMDCIRKHFIYGTQIHKKYVAFCQPTRMGQKFAQTYCQTKHVLVY